MQLKNYVDRNDGDEGQVGSISTRRTNVRKATIIKTSTVTTVNGKPKLQKKKENGWIVEENVVQNVESLCNGDKREMITVKRGKRSLTIEKDKANSPRSVKVLRRSHTQGSNTDTEVKPRAKLSLPVNKKV